MFSFAYPKLLYLLLLIPVLMGLFLLAHYARKRKLSKYGKLDVIEKLMPDASKYKPWVKITLELIAVLALVMVVARPRFGEKEETDTSRGIEVMIAVDVSRSMLASANDDPKGISRLDQAKHILEKLINKLGNDKVGLIAFAGESHTQLPITPDYRSAKLYVNDLSPDIIPVQGTALGTAITMAINSFTPNEEMQKAIIVITDAENHEDDAVGAAKQAAKNDIQVNVIGLGSTKGAPIPSNTEKNEFFSDYNGQLVNTAFNEKIAQDVAKAGDGVYVHGSSQSAVNAITSSLDKLAKSEYTKTQYKASAEQFPLFAWIALAFLLVDIFVLDRKIGWLKNINFFTK